MHRALVLAAMLALGCSGAPHATDTQVEVPCVGCHLDDYETARPPHPGKKPTACAICHRQDGWHPTVLRHDAWPLTGKHLSTDCFGCHRGEPAVFAGTARACVACHADALARENAAATWHARFADTCADCHQTTAWKPAKSEPGFTLHDDPLVPVAAPIAPRKPVKRPQPHPVPGLPDVTPDSTPDSTPDVATGATRRRSTATDAGRPR